MARHGFSAQVANACVLGRQAALVHQHLAGARAGSGRAGAATAAAAPCLRRYLCCPSSKSILPKWSCSSQACVPQLTHSCEGYQPPSLRACGAAAPPQAAYG